MIEFEIIDKKTGKYPDVEEICLKEDWAYNLIYCDIEGFAITEDGSLVLLDECGNVAYCPIDRFEITKIIYQNDNLQDEDDKKDECKVKE